MPFAFFISKSWEGQSRALTPAVQIATFDDSADLLETLLWHSLQKLLRFMVLLSTAPKLMTSLGKHGWRALQQKAQNSLGKRALPSVPHPVTLISADIRGPWKGFPLSSSGGNDIPAVLSSSGIRGQYLKSISQNPVKAGRLVM